jgi:glucuronokinase
LSELVAATVRRFGREFGVRASADAVRWRTTIPVAVGLGGSSAIVIATARALSSLHEVALGPVALARFALAVETEDLGIAAGPQDRLAQAHGGLTFMDFAGGDDLGHCEAMDLSLLPDLLIAWLPDAARQSGEVHDALSRRHRGREPAVVEAMAEAGEAARRARASLLAGDVEGFCESMDRTFDLRRQVIRLDRRCVGMIERARAAGAAANYTGSGGAIVAAALAPARLASAHAALAAIGCHTVQFARVRGQ